MRLFGLIARNSGLNWSPLPMLTGITRYARPHSSSMMRPSSRSASASSRSRSCRAASGCDHAGGRSRRSPRANSRSLPAPRRCARPAPARRGGCSAGVPEKRAAGRAWRSRPAAGWSVSTHDPVRQHLRVADHLGCGSAPARRARRPRSAAPAIRPRPRRAAPSWVICEPRVDVLLAQRRRPEARVLQPFRPFERAGQALPIAGRSAPRR